MGERGVWGALGGVVAEMRDALISEGWFGRRPTEKPGDPLAQFWGAEPDGFARDWAVRAPDPAQPTPAREPGIDR